MDTAPDPAEASRASAAIGQQVGTILPRLVEVAGSDLDLQIRSAREETCLRPENDAPQTNTRWVGLATSPVDDATSANAALDRIDEHLQEDGWERMNEVKKPEAGTRVLYFRKGDLGVTAELMKSASRQSLEVMVDTSCADQPEEHRMQRLELDPGYGQSSKYYDDGK